MAYMRGWIWTVLNGFWGQGEGKKVLGVFYKAHEYADNPEFLGCAENALGIREWLESQGHTYVVTSDKEGPDSGTCTEIQPEM